MNVKLVRGVWAALALGCASLRSDPWAAVAVKSTVNLVNHMREPCVADVRVKRGEIRVLGTVAPDDSATYGLPFEDEEVMVVFCGTPAIVSVKGPHRWRLEAHPNAGHGANQGASAPEPTPRTGAA